MSRHDVEDGSERLASLPAAPNPDVGSRPQETSASGTVSQTQTDSVLVLKDEHWDLYSISGTGAVKMLIEAVQALSEITGDVPPTPPATRPTTPKALSPENTPPGSVRGYPMSPVSPVSPTASHASSITPVCMPSPEAHRDEPTGVEVGAGAESVAVQHAAISRRFFLKTVPPFTISDYLLRLHQYCPHSPGVYLAAAAYIHRLCVAEMLVPATTKTVHRLCLGAIRVASKVLEDNKWSQDRIAKVGGVSRKELHRLEISLCFLLDFELSVREEDMRRRMFLLQQAARQGLSVKRRLSDGFRMKLSIRQKTEIATH